MGVGGGSPLVPLSRGGVGVGRGRVRSRENENSTVVCDLISNGPISRRPPVSFLVSLICQRHPYIFSENSHFLKDALDKTKETKEISNGFH